MPHSDKPGDLVSLDLWPDGAQEHNWCLATRLCRRCGASAAAVATGDRQPYCEPDVIGISWTRAAERIRDQITRDFTEAHWPAAGTREIPLYRPGQSGGLTPDRPRSIGGFRFPDGSLDDGGAGDDPPSAA